jgi:hypothetical protein
MSTPIPPYVPCYVMIVDLDGVTTVLACQNQACGFARIPLGGNVAHDNWHENVFDSTPDSD